jgi:hypothetical protein
MNATRKTVPSDKGQEQLATLQKAVAQALDRKKRLGQYAVVWKDNKPVTIGEDAPEGFRNNRQGL